MGADRVDLIFSRRSRLAIRVEDYGSDHASVDVDLVGSLARRGGNPGEAWASLAADDEGGTAGEEETSEEIVVVGSRDRPRVLFVFFISAQFIWILYVPNPELPGPEIDPGGTGGGPKPPDHDDLCWTLRLARDNVLSQLNELDREYELLLEGMSRIPGDDQSWARKKSIFAYHHVSGKREELQEKLDRLVAELEQADC